jgi:diguanylate cyclase (GGDEF)-like protein
MDSFPAAFSHAQPAKHVGEIEVGDATYAEASGERRQSYFKIVLYLVLFLASSLFQGRLSSGSNLTGVVAQFQVLISVILVMSIPRIGYFVALVANALQLLLLTGLFLFIGDSTVLPGLVVCLCTMLTLTVISLFGRRLHRKNWELSRNEDRLSRLYDKVAEAGRLSAFQANHDELTGLANARHLRSQVARHYEAARPDCPVGGLALIKLENFKVINAIFGPRAGDAVLQAVARRLQEFADQNGHHAARIESSTFSLLFTSPLHAEDALRQLLARLDERLLLEEGILELRACAGYAECGEEAGNAEALYQCAEFALTSAKEAGCRALRGYDSRMDMQARRRLMIINELEMALKREEFTLFYQPQIDVRSGRVIGAEALIRWANARLGSVMPAEFIPVAEQNGQILAMGSWILERACRDASAWPDGWRVSVNVSSAQFFDRSFETHIARALAVSGLPPTRLKLEITESVLIGDEENVVETLRHIRDQRIAISLDDFGTGYSSLSYLKNIPLDELKIDRSFVITMESDPKSRAIVETIVHLARQLNLTTTTEGVETNSQAEILRSLGCDCFQGYLYGKPMPVNELLSMREFSVL